MAITYSLVPIPIWYFSDNSGKPLAGGQMFTYSQLDPTEQKPVFQDPGGINAWTNPVIFDANGSQGPFYWQSDSSNPQDTYFLEIYDSNGNLIRTIENYFPPSGGGGNITNVININNLIINNVMFRNIGSTPNPITQTFFSIAPGANTGLAQTASLFGPDICFSKNNLNATDQLQFVPFILGSNPLTGDVCPQSYLKYLCTNSPTGETYKWVQYPITTNIQSLSNQSVTLTIWARCNSGANTLELQFATFFGDGPSASPTNFFSIQTFNLTTEWQKFNVTTTVPDVSGKTIGECGNSGLFLLVSYPLGLATNIDFVLPSQFLGDDFPTFTYAPEDEIDAVINHPRTFDFRVGGYNYFGWILANDGTIGSLSSGATTRANIDTFPLYNALWTLVSDSYAPVTGGRGASSVSDFSANKTIALTKTLGRAIACSGQGTGLSNWALGQTTGVEQEMIGINGLPTHTHPGSTYSGNINTFSVDRSGLPVGNNLHLFISDASASSSPISGNVNVASDGNGNPINIMQPTIFYNVFFKL